MSPVIHRRAARLGAVLLAGLLASVGGLTGPATAQPSPQGSANATGWYLALGDSLAAGLQPTTGDDKAGGYAGRVLAAVQQDRPKTRLVNLACSGESTVTMTDGGRCAYDEGSQLDQAVEFLHAHRRTTRLVTLTMGSNNVLPCLHGTAIDLPCVQQGLARVQADLPRIVTRLRAAAPEARIVVTSYYNPFAVAPEPTRTSSVQLTAALNQVVAAAARASDARVADVAGEFHTFAPDAAAVVCAWTWMCTPYTNIHANDAGYAAMARAVEEVL